MWPPAPHSRAPGPPLPALTLSARRVTVMALGFNALFLGLAGRLYQMQVVDHPHYVQSSVNNVQQPTPRLARRGRLITQDGVVLADNRVVADLIVIGGQPPVREQDWKRIRALLGLGTADLPPLAPGRRVTLMMNVPPDKLPGLSEWLVGVPAFTLDYRVERFYPEGSLAGNLTGSLGLATAAEVKSGAFIPEHQVGRSGLEASLDARLRGVDGLEWRHMNAQGLEWGRTVVREAQAGPDVHLTINAGLQRVAEQALREARADINRYRVQHGRPTVQQVRGALVALDPRTGEVLVMASSPALDPNWFVQRPRPKALVQALTGESGSLLNRAVQAYAPGSVFKTTSTLAYVDLYGDRTYPCPPGITYGGRYKRNWARRDLGPQDARGAIAQSCNPWYYQAAIDRGPLPFSDTLARYAQAIGYGRKTGVELIGEKVGLVPSASDHEQRGQVWYPGFTLNYAIGQGDLLATPLQVAQVLSTTINHGLERPLTLLHSPPGKPHARTRVQQIALNVKPTSWKLVMEGMEQTVRNGTATAVLGPGHFPVSTGGKTGTAETSQGTSMEHSWYQGYGPLDAPNLVVVVFFENGGEGSGAALKAARKVMAAAWDVPGE